MTARWTARGAALASWLWFVGAAGAQPMGRTVVVPFTAGRALPVMQFTQAKQLEAELSRQRVVIISLHDAHDRFSARSRMPQAPAQSDLDALAREAQAAIEHVAFGRTSAAQRSVRRIVELADRSLETLNRETATARSLLDACLALVRSSLHENQRDDALDQAMRCRRLVPDLAPSDVAHPANVVGALAEADDQLRRMRVGKLSVSATPERSCELYLNGRHLGHTPFALERAPAGEYRVQVECSPDQRGRVHVVQLGDEPVKLDVDAGFDAAVASEPRLSLHYASANDARGVLVRHAALLGKVVHADDVVLIGTLDGRSTLLRVQTSHGRLVAGAGAQGSDDTSSLARASQVLTEARFAALDPDSFRSVEQTVAARQPHPSAAAIGPPPTALQSVASPSPSNSSSPGEAPEAQGPEPGRPHALRITGSVLSGLGMAGIGAGIGTYVHSQKLRQDAEAGEAGSEQQQQRQAEYDDFRLVPLLGVAGSALLTAGIPMLLPEDGPRSRAAWVGGALAGAAGIAAIALGATWARSDPVLGGLLISGGVPLLTIPITQLIRASRSTRPRK